MIRLRGSHLRASRYGGQAAASARQVRLRLRLRRFAATAAAVLLVGGSSVFACPLCFGAEETPLIDGAKLGVVVMLGVLFAVQGGFVAFFLYLRRRAKQNADIELDLEWSEFQRGSRTS